MAVHFPSFPLYMASTGAVISLKSGVFAVALLDKVMPLSLSPQCESPCKFPENGAVVTSDCLSCLKSTFIVWD